MCKYCEQKQEKIRTDKDLIDAHIEKNKIMIDYSAYSCDSDFYDEGIEINYCPFCGKKLTET